VQCFDDLWKAAVRRSDCFPVVQEYLELKHIYELIDGCKSYLEIGTAEGNSLYVLSHALAKEAKIVCVDYGEKHTRKHQENVLELLESEGINAVICTGNSHDNSTLLDCFKCAYDVVFIDAGHTYADVVADAVMYGCYARKYIIFHDVCLPDVARAFEWYCTQIKYKNAYKFIRSQQFGYGVIEL